MKIHFDNLQEIKRTELLGNHVLDHEKLDEFELGIFCKLAGIKF